MKTTETFERFYCDTVRDMWVLYECLKTAALTESKYGAGENLEGARHEVLGNLAHAIVDLDVLSYNLDISSEDNRQEIIREIQERRIQFVREPPSDMVRENIADLLVWAEQQNIASIGDVPAGDVPNHEQRIPDMEMKIKPEAGQPEQ